MSKVKQPVMASLIAVHVKLANTANTVANRVVHAEFVQNQNSHMEEGKISAKLKGQFLRLYQMAASDGEFSKSEMELLYAYAVDKGVSQSDLMKILTSPVGKIAIPETLETKVEYLSDLARMILADGVVREDELNTLKKYAGRFGFLQENLDDLAEYLISSIKESKWSLDETKRLVESFTQDYEVIKTWPTGESEYGDYYFVCH